MNNMLAKDTISRLLELHKLKDPYMKQFRILHAEKNYSKISEVLKKMDPINDEMANILALIKQIYDDFKIEVDIHREYKQLIEDQLQQ